ncbi:MAG: Swt1 family HEPN domain-containing protein [Acidobacteriaceae bacterium]
MAATNAERVGRGLDLLKTGLFPFVERELKNVYKQRWQESVLPSFPDWQTRAYELKRGEINWDVQALLSVMLGQWNEVFKKTIGPSERTLVNELVQVRNKHAHQKAFSTDEAYRALDSVSLLLKSVSALEAGEAEAMKAELLRLKYEEQVRTERRKEAAAPVEGRPVGGLRPWREIAVPHPDVASGRYMKAEFAADLWQVSHDEGPDEYQNPVEFYRRTYLTEGLQTLLKNAIRRLAGQGGDPVVELQTNFGGGKTHSMLALYHLCGNVPPSGLPGMDTLATEVGLSMPPKIHRAVLVGNKLSPAKEDRKPDGTVVRTMWGELAWQLGGREGYELVRAADENSVSPGDELRVLLKKYSPCLILIDEWIAYVRLLYGKNDLVGGNFDSQFTFAQTLSESAKLVDNALLVVSIPASQAEIGGEGGQAALERLKNVMQRVETSWRPASAEESFEIVRRRLFQPMTDPELLKQRDVVIRAFTDEYRKNPEEFPDEVSKTDYEQRMKRAYPVHPELFDRLYNDWASLERFQKTRGVLRLMSAVIHHLWERNDANLLVLPASVPVDATEVQEELIRYLPEGWKHVIERDIDGARSLPLRMDGENPLFGRVSACRRVARTLYLGSAPTFHAARKGIEDRRIKLGCVQPGENSATFGDALRKLVDQSTHLYLDGNRYWYSTQASVARLALERAAAQADHDVLDLVRRRLQEQAKERGEFARVHVCPPTSNDVSDDQEARLVILSPEQPHVPKQPSSTAVLEAQKILDRDGAGRSCRNMLVFLAADQGKWNDLKQAARLELAWESIVKEIDQRTLIVETTEGDQAKKKLEAAKQTVQAQVPECYMWLLVPEQATPVQGQKIPDVEIREYGLKGDGPLAVRASKRMIKDELLMREMAGTRLRHEIEQVPLWRGNAVSVKQLVEDFSSNIYLPRVKNAQVLLNAIEDGVKSFSWDVETFAYADGSDKKTNRYLGLVGGRQAQVRLDRESLVVKPSIAAEQLRMDRKAADATGIVSSTPNAPTASLSSFSAQDNGAAARKKQLCRFHATAKLDPTRVARDAGDISEAIIQHLAALVDADVTVTLEIQAAVPNGVPENVVRTVSENALTLKFIAADFEES